MLPISFSAMYATLKLFHFLALVFGAAASLGNVYLMLSKGPHDLDAPGFTNMLRKLYRTTALGAILLFWASGIPMYLWLHGFEAPGKVATLKLLSVLVLTGIVLFVNIMAPGWTRRGGPPDYLSSIHWLAAGLLLLAVVCAPYAFG